MIGLKLFQQNLHQIFTIMVIMKLLVASRPPRIYNLIAEDKSIDYNPYDSAIGPYQRCVSMCTLDSECFSFDFTPQSTTPYGECRLYDTTYSIYTNQSRVLTTQTGTRYYSTFPKDCADLYTLGLRQSGVYQNAHHLLGPVFFMAFNMMSNWVMINMMISILDDASAAVKKEQESIRSEDAEAMNLLFQYFKGILFE